MAATFINKLKQHYLFILAGFLLLLYRGVILSQFGFKYTDVDQAIMWLGTKHFASGQFHEPRFYGQDYNTMLEALLAVPLYVLGIGLFFTLQKSSVQQENHPQK